LHLSRQSIFLHPLIIAKVIAILGRLTDNGGSDRRPRRPGSERPVWQRLGRSGTSLEAKGNKYMIASLDDPVSHSLKEQEDDL